MNMLKRQRKIESEGVSKENIERERVKEAGGTKVKRMSELRSEAND